eukprot:GHVT01043190.1.p1 GENE.GHVT01043190.1~~GHVT01043190.1.p1  ORF type:complete len:421 (+),score=113.96 GHVT01043190.1:320-1582(+)
MGGGACACGAAVGASNVASVTGTSLASSLSCSCLPSSWGRGSSAASIPGAAPPTAPYASPPPASAASAARGAPTNPNSVAATTTATTTATTSVCTAGSSGGVYTPPECFPPGGVRPLAAASALCSALPAGDSLAPGGPVVPPACEEFDFLLSLPHRESADPLNRDDLICEVAGVYWDKRSWIASWYDNGRRYYKSFSAKAHGFYHAKYCAIQVRLAKVKDETLNNKGMKLRNCPPKISKHAKVKRERLSANPHTQFNLNLLKQQQQQQQQQLNNNMFHPDSNSNSLMQVDTHEKTTLSHGPDAATTTTDSPDVDDVDEAADAASPAHESDSAHAHAAASATTPSTTTSTTNTTTNTTTAAASASAALMRLSESTEANKTKKEASESSASALPNGLKPQRVASRSTRLIQGSSYADALNAA